MKLSQQILLLGLLGLLGYAGTHLFASSGSETVDGKPGTVYQNEDVDGDAQKSTPDLVESIGEDAEKIRITSKTLNPPTGWKFRRFHFFEQLIGVPEVINPSPSYPSPWVDFHSGPPTPETPEVLVADTDNIQFQAIFLPPTNAGRWPLRAEGNLTRNSGGGKGLIPEKHWQLEVSDIFVRFINAGDEEVELSTGFTHSNPVVKVGIGEELDDISLSDLSVDYASATATVHIHGEVRCDIADVVEDGSANIQNVVVVVRDVNGNGGHIETQVAVTNESPYDLEFDYRPQNTDQDPPHPYIGKFETDVTIPLTTGDLLVTAYAVNAIGNDGSDSFTVAVNGVDIEGDVDPSGHEAIKVVGVSSGYLSAVHNNDSTGRGIFNPIWVYVEDETINESNIASKTIEFFNGDDFELMIDPYDDRIRTKVPFIQVGRPFIFGTMPDNVINAESNGATQYATYPEVTRELEYSYTAASPSNYYKYAQGTTVKHNWYSELLTKGWTVDSVSVYEKTGWTWTYSAAADTNSTVTSHKAIANRGGKGGREFTIQLGPTSSKHGQKSLRIVLKKGTKTKILKHQAKFKVIPLKTIFIAVDGLAYASAQSVTTGAGATPTFKKVFDGAVQPTQPALAALPTITWTNWPGIFSGDPPNKTGWVGNSWFARAITSGNTRYPMVSANTPAPALNNKKLKLDQRQSAGIALGGALGVPDAFDMPSRAIPSAGSVYDNMAAAFIPASHKLQAESIRLFWDKSTSAKVNLSSTHFVSSDPHGHSAADAKTLDDDGDNILPAGFIVGDTVGTGPQAKLRWKSRRDSLDMLVAYFPGPDNVAHGVGAMAAPPPAGFTSGTIGNVSTPLPSIAEQVVNVTDGALKRLVDEIEKDGYLNACIFVLAADHGLIAYRNTDAFNITSEEGGVLEIQRLFDIPGAGGGLGMLFWRNIGTLPNDVFHAEINSYRSVYSGNGGLAQFYLRGTNRPWQQPAFNADIEACASLLYRESMGYAGQLYGELAPHAAAPPVPATNGAFGNPPAIFVKYGGTDATTNTSNNNFKRDFEWVKSVSALPPFAVTKGTIDEFIAARAAAGNPVDWPAFAARLDDMNHKFSAGSRTGDIITVMNGEEGFLAINAGDGFNGWHGGPTEAESYVPMMFHMPGGALVRPAGKTNPQFVHDAFDAYTAANTPADGFLRSYQLPDVLVDILSKVRATNDDY